MMFSMMYAAILLIVIFLLSTISGLINVKLKQDREKYSVFECGFDLLSNLRLPFSLNFYFIIIIFLIFDVELTLILPFIYGMKLVFIKHIFLILIMFFVVLIVGFIYEWMVGLLNWLI